MTSPVSNSEASVHHPIHQRSWHFQSCVSAADKPSSQHEVCPDPQELPTTRHRPYERKKNAIFSTNQKQSLECTEAAAGGGDNDILYQKMSSLQFSIKGLPYNNCHVRSFQSIYHNIPLFLPFFSHIWIFNFHLLCLFLFIILFLRRMISTLCSLSFYQRHCDRPTVPCLLIHL